MDQKNTIVKCKAHPNCLFNHNGVCDNYVINIGADRNCEDYVETENTYIPPSAQEILEYTIELEQEKLMRGQRAKCNIYEDACDKNNCDFPCTYADTDPCGYLWCCLNKCNPKLPLLCPHYTERMIEFGD